MNRRQHNSQDYGMKVWLDDTEVRQLLDAAEDTEQRIAFGLGARCGLRSKEWLDVEPRHVVDTAAGTMLQVPEGKGDKYRETPITTELATAIRTVGDMNGSDSTPVIRSASSTRVLRKWLERARDRLHDETGKDGWLDVSTHDLRRTWATRLQSSDVDPLVVLSWGGWEDLETFLDHYEGSHSPEMQKREREKVAWL